MSTVYENTLDYRAISKIVKTLEKALVRLLSRHGANPNFSSGRIEYLGSF
jgi:hypothetical protein